MRRAKRRSPEEPLLSGGVGSDLAWILVLAFFVAVPSEGIHAIPLVEPIHSPGSLRRGGCDAPQIIVQLLSGDRVSIRGRLFSVDEAVDAVETRAAGAPRLQLILAPSARSENGLLVRMIDEVRRSPSLGEIEISIAQTVD
ncbi:MAG: hypothetical protein NXI30_03390 [bacterium]|nr:hypothetical protein [bacterium]